MNKVQKAVQDFSELQKQKEELIKQTQPEIDKVSKKVANEKKYYDQLLKAQERGIYLPIIISMVIMIIILLFLKNII